MDGGVTINACTRHYVIQKMEVLVSITVVILEISYDTFSWRFAFLSVASLPFVREGRSLVALPYGCQLVMFAKRLLQVC